MSVSLESASRLSALKSKIDTATGKSSSTLSQAVDNAIERGNIQTETKTVTPTASQQIITPSSGKYLSKVTVSAVPTETKTVTPTASQQIITPSSGKFLSQATVNAVPTMTKTITPTESAQTIYPDAGKFFSSVTVEAAKGGIEGVVSGTVHGSTLQGEWVSFAPGFYPGDAKLLYMQCENDAVTDSSGAQIITGLTGFFDFKNYGSAHSVLIRYSFFAVGDGAYYHNQFEHTTNISIELDMVGDFVFAFNMYSTNYKFDPNATYTWYAFT